MHQLCTDQVEMLDRGRGEDEDQYPPGPRRAMTESAARQSVDTVGA
ncbi:hypothetical protein [Mycobacterium simiae]|nr:hypothetical protein [Mycobacterium simiae]